MISFDFAAVATWPKVRPYFVGPRRLHAYCKGDFSDALWNVPQECLAVNGDVVPVGTVAKVVDPVPQTLAKHGGFQPGKHAAERIVRRNAVRQFQKLLEKCPLSFPVPLNVRERFAPRQYAASGQHDHINEPMQLATRFTRGSCATIGSNHSTKRLATRPSMIVSP